ncbi:MAG: hypothetical protein HY236_03585 [Acidobacteria bacterium]|nr:hypothetical protein [Acidobacteriota bacterium]
MAVLKRRTRMVNFRLSEDEYEYLKNMCLNEGARSISDFARAAVCRSLASHSGPQGEGLDAWVRKLNGKVEELDRAVRELAEQVGNGSRSRARRKLEIAESA